MRGLSTCLCLALPLVCLPLPTGAAEKAERPLVSLLLWEVQSWEDPVERAKTSIRLLELLAGQPQEELRKSILAVAEAGYGQGLAAGKEFYWLFLSEMAEAYVAAGDPERAMEWVARLDACVRKESDGSRLDSWLALSLRYAALGKEPERLEQLARVKAAAAEYRAADGGELDCYAVKEAFDTGLWAHGLDVALALGCSLEEQVPVLRKRIASTGDPVAAEVLRRASVAALVPPVTAKDSPELWLAEGQLQKALKLWCRRNLGPDGSCPPQEAFAILSEQWSEMIRFGRNEAAGLLADELERRLDAACCVRDWVYATIDLAAALLDTGETERARPLLERLRSSAPPELVLEKSVRLLEAALAMQKANKAELAHELLALWEAALERTARVHGTDDIVDVGLLGRLRKEMPETTWHAAFDALQQRISALPDGLSALGTLALCSEWLEAGDKARAKELLAATEQHLQAVSIVLDVRVHARFGQLASRLGELDRGRRVLAIFIERQRERSALRHGEQDRTLEDVFKAAEALVAAGMEYADLAEPHLDAWTELVLKRFDGAVVKWQAKDAGGDAPERYEAWSSSSFEWSGIPEPLKVAADTARTLHRWGLTRRADEVRDSLRNVIDATGHHAACLAVATALVDSFPPCPERTAAAMDAVDARFAYWRSLRTLDEVRAASWLGNEMAAFAGLCREKRFGEPTGIDAAAVAQRVLDVLRKESSEERRSSFVRELLPALAEW